ncbi:GNAT family N-acetyltransferase, partial [Streptomyces sp. NPDC059202]|uniref:GNAT family N-acetyltransferase n=1 Tax=Streptomyces sp. NPDC059202 TaxID=3346768 RepID=UPI0036B00F1B
MKTTVVRPGELDTTALTVWRSLLGRQEAASPFLSPEFARAVGRFRPGARVAVLEDGRGPVGFFPFERRPLGLGRPIGDGVCDCQGLVGDAGATGPDGVGDSAELLRACGLQVWQFDHLAAGQPLFAPGVARRATSPVVVCADTEPGAVLAHASSAFRRDVRTKEHRLARRAGDVRFVFDSHDPEALEALMAWKSAQYRAKGRIDQFSRPWVAATVRELLRAGSPACSGTLSVLYADHRPVACHFGLRSRSVLTYWFPAYDPAWASCSPGILLLVGILRAAAEAGLHHVDLGRGDDRYKTQLKTGDLVVGEGQVSRPTARAALRSAESAAVGRTRSLVAGNPVLRGAAVGTLNACL